MSKNALKQTLCNFAQALSPTHSQSHRHAKQLAQSLGITNPITSLAKVSKFFNISHICFKSNTLKH